MRLTNKHGLPATVVAAVERDPYTGGGDISATRLIDAPQVVHLAKRHADKLEVDVSDRIWSLLGQSVHTILERAGLRQEGMVAETRLYADVLGWKISGQYDVLDLDRKCLVDYKVTTVWKKDGTDNWVRQLNVLRWLAHQNGETVESAEVVAIFRDWRKAEAERSADYPRAPMQVIPVPLWTLEEAEDYVYERVAAHQAVARGVAVPCSDEERWKEADKWALIKPGASRALQVLDHEPAASVVPHGYVVQHRPGQYKRCALYCDVSSFCPQWAADSATPTSED